MRLVDAIQDARSFDRTGRMAFALCRGEVYALFDSEAAAAVAGGAVIDRGALALELPRAATPLAPGARVVVPFIGGLGDAVVLASALAMRPDVSFTVSCPRSHWELFERLDVDLRCVPHPLRSADLADYDGWTCLEGLDARHGVGTPFMARFADVLGVPHPAEPVRLRAGFQPPDRPADPDRPAVAVVLGRIQNVRAYPAERVAALAQALVTAGCSVTLVGRAEEVGRSLPHAPPHLVNGVGQTPTLDTLLAALARHDVIVCPDSFFAHLAAVLRRPAVVLFTSTVADSVGGYARTAALTPGLACSPCGATGTRCPLGHGRCLAGFDPALDSDRVAAVVLEAARSRPAAHGERTARHLVPDRGDVTEADQEIR